MVVLGVVMILGGVVAVRAETLSTPDLSLRRVLPASVTFPGPHPQLSWPTQGEAAVDVEGLPSLGSHGPDRPLPIASLAKVMTAYVVLRDHPVGAGQLGLSVTIGAADVSDYRQRLAQAQSVVPVAAGETLDEAQLLQALLVGSGNNIAVILADHDAGSVPAFVARMNSTARQLGMTHTTYTDPSGLAPTTVSDASDQLLLAEAAMTIPLFAQTVAMVSVNLPVAGVVPNFDRAVGTGGYVGIKTGSDQTAGGCLLFADRQVVDKRTVTVIGAVLGQDAGQQSTTVLITAAITAATTLVQSVTRSVSVATVVPVGTPVAQVSNAQGNRVTAATTGPLSAVGFGGIEVPLTVVVSPLGRTLAPGRQVASVRLADEPGVGTKAVAEVGLPAVGFTWRLRHAL